MSYATPDDAVSQLGEREAIALTDRDNLGTLDSAELQKALDRASGEIDLYLVGRYALPLTVVPPLIVTYCVDIARYRLSGSDVTETDPVRTRYKDALRFLEGVRDGKNKLPAEVPTAGADGTQNLAYVAPSDNGRVFSRVNR